MNLSKNILMRKGLSIKNNGNVGIGTTSPATTGLELGTGKTIGFEGATADDFETAFSITDPTADRTVTIPNNTGTMALTSDIAYSSAIAADDFTQAEVDNLRTAKLDDATTPWTSASNITSGTLTNISAATPTADTHVATKAYVDAAGGGCYSKCADSGTAAGGATPTCAAGYTSVDTWSERAGYAMKQWQGMNSTAHTGHFLYYKSYNNYNTWHTFTAPSQDRQLEKPTGGGYWNTGYTAGSAIASYYNDCTACCAD